jgi:flagellar hook-associated protein 2
MASFQSSVGLVTGLEIGDIVDQLMEIASTSRDRLETRTKALTEQQNALNQLLALTIGTQLASTKLSNTALYEQRTASSSNGDILSGTVTGSAIPGAYQFTPVRMAQNHQLVSGGVASLDDPVGAGTLSLQFGGFADTGMSLATLNGGQGVERGQIRITDRSGASEIIDLRYALSINDVLDEINTSENIRVRAEIAGDAIRLVDVTGQAVTNLSVHEVGGGSTAADLGLADIDVAASQGTGHDLVQMYDALAVSQLNDNTGLSIRDELPDLEIQFRDGSAALQIDLENKDISTVGDLLEALNAADPARLRAELGADGKRLVLTDLTADAGGTFSIASAFGGSLAEDLGLTGTAVGGVLTGDRIMGALQGTLLGSLAGGSGLGTLGQLQITDRSGASATVDLAGAETLNEVIDRINAAGIGVTAGINDARNGLVLRDTTDATTSNLIVANADATNTADALGLAVNAAQSSVDSGSLHLQVFHEGLLLESLNNGSGVRLGSFLITDSNGKSSGVNLRTAEARTVGDVLDLINGLGLAVEARVNDTGDGIMLVDTGSGAETLTVRESGSGTTAADLKLLGEAAVVNLQGTPTQVIDGKTTARVTIAADDTLQDVVDKINDLQMGVTASIFQSGSGTTPYRLVLSSGRAGASGEMLVDASGWQLDFFETAAAQDAILQVGSSNVTGGGLLATSGTNSFRGVLDGVNLTLGGVSDSPVTITVASSDSNLVSAVKTFVDQYNKLHDKIDELTYFDANGKTTGILMGSNETLQIESRLSRLLSGRFFGVGSIYSLEQVGISFNDDGQLELDQSQLDKAFADDPEAVEKFFTDSTNGLVTKFNDAVESLAGEDHSVLVSRNDALQRRIDENNDRIEDYDTRLERQRARLMTYYYNLELAISKIQSNLSTVENLTNLSSTTTKSIT